MKERGTRDVNGSSLHLDRSHDYRPHLKLVRALGTNLTNLLVMLVQQASEERLGAAGKLRNQITDSYPAATRSGSYDGRDR